MRNLFSLYIAALPLLFVATDAFARAGGGGGGGSGQGSGVLGIILAPFFIAYYIYRMMKIRAKASRVSAALLQMARREPAWSEDYLLEFSERSFREAQVMWGEQDLAGLKDILHPTLYPSWASEINGHKRMNKKNEMTGISISEMKIVDVKNFINDERDNFTVYFKVSCVDSWSQKGKTTESKDSHFEEFWTFEWESGKWQLRSVTQQEGWKKFIESPILYEAKNQFKKSA